MAQFVNEFEIDLKKPMAPQQLRQCVGEGDAYGMQVGARVFNDGEYVALGGSCVGKVIRADGATIQLTGTVSGNLAYVVLDQTCCAVEGPLQVAVCWVQNTAVTTLLVAYGTVINTQTGTAIQPSTPLPDLTELLAEIDEMRAATADAEALLDTALTYNLVTQTSAESAYSKLAANLPGNTFCFVSGNWFTDLPAGTYWLFTIAAKELYTDFAAQFVYFADTGKTLTRRRDYVSGAWTWTAWVDRVNDLSNISMQFLTVTEGSAASQYSGHAANLPGNTFCFISSSWFDDVPAGANWIFTISYGKDYSTYAEQFALVASTGKLWIRRRNYSSNAWTWMPWALKDDPENTLLWMGTLANNTDLNSIDNLSLYGLSDSYTYTNKPTLLSSGYLFTVNFGAGFVTQFASDLDGSNVYSRRKRSGVWSDWFCGVHDTTAKYFAFGDSTTYGQIPGTANQSKYNYPACVGKLLHMQTINKGVPGQGLLTDWDDIQTDFIDGLDMTGAKLVTLAWAYNDGSQYGSINFGEYTDTGSTTFIGKYFTIMKQFQQKCPYAKIVLITGFGYPDGQVGPPAVKPTFSEQFKHIYTFADGQKTIKQMYDTLEAMCNLHGWSCINQATGTVFNAWNVDEMIGDQIHPTEAGYLTYGNFLAGRIASMYGNIAAWL